MTGNRNVFISPKIMISPKINQKLFLDRDSETKIHSPRFHKSKIFSKIETWVKNRNFGQKSKLWSKIDILVKNRNFGKNRKFGQKLILWSKIETLVKIESLVKIKPLFNNFYVSNFFLILYCFSRIFGKLPID